MAGQKVQQLLLRHGAGIVVALDPVHPQLGETGELPLGLHALGQNAQAQLVKELHQRAHQSAAVLRMVDADHQGPVQLDQLKRKLHGGGKVGIAGTEIIQIKNKAVLGHLQRLRFLFKGGSYEYILDRLPTAKVVEEGENGTLIEAEVFGKGIDIWLKSQGELIEVISRQEIPVN